MTKSVAQLLSAGHLLLLPPLLLAAAAARNYCLCAGRSTWRPVSAARDSHCWRRSSPSVGAAPLPGAHASRRSASTTSSEARGAPPPPPPPPASKAPSLGGTNEPDEQTSARLSRSPLAAPRLASPERDGNWIMAAGRSVAARSLYFSQLARAGRGARADRARGQPTDRPTDRPTERAANHNLGPND